MANRALAIGRGISQGAEKAATNLFNIQVARKKLDRENEAFSLDKKVKEAQIKKLEFEGIVEPEKIKLESEKLKASTKAQNAAYNLSILKIEQAQSGEKRKVESFEKMMKAMENMSGDEGGTGLDWSYKADGLTIKKPTTKQPTWKQEQDVNSVKAGLLEGQIKVGKDFRGDPIIEYPKTREEATESLIAAEQNPHLYEAELEQKYGSAESVETDERQTKINAAKEAGYSDKEIAEYLKGQ